MSEGDEDSTEVNVEAQETDKSEDPVEITIGDKVEEQGEVFIPLDFLLTVPGLGKSQANRIIMMGYKDKTSILNLTEEELLRIPDMPVSMAKRIVNTINLSQKKDKGDVEDEEEKEEDKKEEEETSAEPEAQPTSEGPPSEKKDEGEKKEEKEEEDEKKEEENEEKEEVVFKIKGEEGEGEKEEEQREPAEKEEEEDKKKDDESDDSPYPQKQASSEDDEGEEGPGFFAKIKSSIGGIFKSDDDEEKEKKEEEKEEKPEEHVEEKKDTEDEFKIEGVDDNIMDVLKDAGYQDISEVAEAIVEDLTMIDGIDEETAKKIYSALHSEE